MASEKIKGCSLLSKVRLFSIYDPSNLFRHSKAYIMPLRYFNSV